MNEFSWNFVFKDFWKISRENSSFIKIWQEWRVLYCISRIVLYCIILHCIVSYRILLYFIVWYCIVSYRIVLYCIVLYCTVSYRIVSYGNVLYCIVWYCVYRIVLYCIYRIVSYRTVSYRIVSYRVLSYRNVLYCIVFEVPCTFTITSHSVLRIRNVSTKVAEKIETLILIEIQYMPFMR